MSTTGANVVNGAGGDDVEDGDVQDLPEVRRGGHGGGAAGDDQGPDGTAGAALDELVDEIYVVFHQPPEIVLVPGAVGEVEPIGEDD